MEAEYQPGIVEQWYNRTIALNRNWRESKQEEKRLKERQGAPASRQEASKQ